MMDCDPLTGVCQWPDQAVPKTPMPSTRKGVAVHYVGDPMCSWCWGISPAVQELAAYCESNRIEFTLNMGGLRAGGGDPWTAEFREFLRSEWQHIESVSGQPFGYRLLELDQFDYDTEPACRAVTTAGLMVKKGIAPAQMALHFLSAVQRKFYVDGKDPKNEDFYADICVDLGIAFESFVAIYRSPQALQEVLQGFGRCRRWGVRSFPTILIERDGSIHTLNQGYVTAAVLISSLRLLLPSSVPTFI